MTSLLILLGLALQDPPPIQEETLREHAREMRLACATALEAVDGVGPIGVGGIGTDYRLLIPVRDAATQRRVRGLVGDAYGGVRIVWSIAPVPRRAGPPEPLRPPAPEAAPERMTPGTASALDCDIIREHLQLSPLTHPAGNGTMWAPCQLVKRSALGPDGATTITTTVHRPDCPIRLGRASEWPGADDFIVWVFRQAPPPPPVGIWTPAPPEAAPAPPQWVGGYGWVAPPAPVPVVVTSYRLWWHPHLWIPLRRCHTWHLHR